MTIKFKLNIIVPKKLKKFIKDDTIEVSVDTKITLKTILAIFATIGSIIGWIITFL